MPIQGCGVAKNWRLFGGVGFLMILGVGVGYSARLRLRKSNWIIFYMALLSWDFLLKWCNFLWNFYWNREFLLCTTISI